MTKEIQHELCKHLAANGYEHFCENYGHIVYEFDVALLSKSNMLSEYEVKISRSDFMADKNKGKFYGIRKFELYDNPKNNERKCPNYFYYVCPKDLIKHNEIPIYAGLIYYSTEDGIELIKSPKRIHNIPSDRIQIINKMLRMTMQRKYLGGTLMTYKNNLIKQKYFNP